MTTFPSLPSLGNPALYWAAGAFLVFLSIRFMRLHYLRRVARRRLQVNPYIPGLPRAGQAETAQPDSPAAEATIYGLSSSAEYLWGIYSIDPRIIAAADFASIADIASPLDFARHVTEALEGLDPEERAGYLNRLLGYVGEQRAFELLISNGHRVEWAASANQPIWDLLVDGELVNIKTVASTDAVTDVAAAHADVTYLLSEDAAGDLSSNMVALEGLDHADLQHSLADAVDLADGSILSESGLIVGTAVRFSRQLVAVGEGKPFKRASADLALDTALIAAGASLGALAGLALSGATEAVAPGLGGLLGGMLGAFLGKTLANSQKTVHFVEANGRFLRALDAIGQASLDSVRGELERFRHEVVERQEGLERLYRQRRSWRHRLWPEPAVVAIEQAVAHGRQVRAGADKAIQHFVGSLCQRDDEAGLSRLGIVVVDAPYFLARAALPDSLMTEFRAARDQLREERRLLDLEVTGARRVTEVARDKIKQYDDLEPFSEVVATRPPSPWILLPLPVAVLGMWLVLPYADQIFDAARPSLNRLTFGLVRDPERERLEAIQREREALSEAAAKEEQRLEQARQSASRRVDWMTGIALATSGEAAVEQYLAKDGAIHILRSDRVTLADGEAAALVTFLRKPDDYLDDKSWRAAHFPQYRVALIRPLLDEVRTTDYVWGKPVNPGRPSEVLLLKGREGADGVYTFQYVVAAIAGWSVVPIMESAPFQNQYSHCPYEGCALEEIVWEPADGVATSRRVVTERRFSPRLSGDGGDIGGGAREDEPIAERRLEYSDDEVAAALQRSH